MDDGRTIHAQSEECRKTNAHKQRQWKCSKATQRVIREHLQDLRSHLKAQRIERQPYAVDYWGVYH